MLSAMNGLNIWLLASVFKYNLIVIYYGKQKQQQPRNLKVDTKLKPVQAPVGTTNTLKYRMYPFPHPYTHLYCISPGWLCSKVYSSGATMLLWCKSLYQH